ncbi:MAG TPA: TOBE domain-containing protein, partial [Acidisoma sp.]|nr:TOBE domain-containing protein [Acidisoma sp.]
GNGVRMGEAFLPSLAAGRLPSGTDVELFLRPEHVLLTGRDGASPLGAVPATVQEVTFFGSLTRMKLELSDGASGEIWADLPSDNAGRFAIGMPVWASWEPESPRVLAR